MRSIFTLAALCLVACSILVPTYAITHAEIDGIMSQLRLRHNGVNARRLANGEMNEAHVMIDAPPSLVAATLHHRAMQDNITYSSTAYLGDNNMIRVGRIIDLTQTHNDSVPGDVDSASKPVWTQVSHTQTVNVSYYAKDMWVIGAGSGTHMDSPCHVYNPPCRAVHEITPAERFSPLVIINVTTQCNANPDYQTQISDYTAWEAVNGPIPAGAFILHYYGWAWRFYTEAEYRNYDANGVPHWPGVSAAASTWLVTQRNIHGTGSTTISMDAGNNFWYSSHYIILGANKYGVENLKQDDSIPVKGCNIVIGRTKKQGAPETHVDAIVMCPY